MTIGIIGFGIIGERHFKNIRQLYPRFSVKILTKRRDVAESEKVKVFSSAQKFFDGKTDVFFITNETHKHTQTILDCLRYSPKAIFIEKPISHDLKNLEKVQKVIKSKKTVFFVGYCLHFYRSLMELKKIIQTGKIGKVFYIRASVGQDLRTFNGRDYKKTFRFDKSQGGGVVLDLIHDINYPGWLLDEKTTFKKGLSITSGLFPMKAEDLSESILMTETGKMISIHQDFLRFVGRRYCEAVGTEGSAFWDGAKNEIIVESRGQKKPRVVSPSKNNMYVDELKFFIKKVKENKGFSNLEEAVQDLKNALLIKKS